MNFMSKRTTIQVKVPREDCLRTFPIDGCTRFRDLFCALIDEGCFAPSGDEKPVWVLLCGDEDLITWNTADHAFFDRFPFGEPPIAGVPRWAGRTVHFVSYPCPLARAEWIYRCFGGSKAAMGHEGFLTEYRSCNVPPALEARWQAAEMEEALP